MPRISANTAEKKSRLHGAIEQRVKELRKLGPRTDQPQENSPYQPSAVDGENLDRVASMLPRASSPDPIDPYVIERTIHEATKEDVLKAKHPKMRFASDAGRDFVQTTLVDLLVQNEHPAIDVTRTGLSKGKA